MYFLCLRFLKSIMESLPEAIGKCEIYLPDVEKRQMEVVLQFLYTGKLKLSADIVQPVRDLLVKVLRIDADFKLPSEDTFNGLLKNNLDKDQDKGHGGNGSNSSPPSSDSSRFDGSQEPPKKKFRSDDNNPSGNGSNGTRPEDSLQIPMSPPHDLEHLIDDDDIRVITPPPKAPPQIVDISDNEDEISEVTHNTDILKIMNSRFEEQQNESSAITESPSKEPAQEIKTYTYLQPSPPDDEFCIDDEVIVEDTSVSETTQDNMNSSNNGEAVTRSIDTSQETPEELERKRVLLESLMLVQTSSSNGELSNKPSEDTDIEHINDTPNDRDSAQIDNSNESRTEEANHSAQDRFESLQLPPAPKIITKKTGYRGPKGRPKPKSLQRRSTPPPPPVTNEDTQNDDTPVQETISVPDSPPPSLIENRPPSPEVLSRSIRSTRTSNGVLPRQYLNAFLDDFSDDEGDRLVDPTFEIQNVLQNAPTNILPPVLPPPLPVAPEPGVVLYRGEWMKAEKVQRLKNRKLMNNAKNINRVRRYNPSDASVTGKRLEGIDQFRQEAEGIHPCLICGATFAISRSLDVHMKRSHNPNLRFECPEKCGKWFSSKNAIPKHLLSHRPQHEWPYVCLFCGKHFQARGDLPKHYRTSQHINDPRIPKLGTDAWTDLMQKSEVFPWRRSMTANNSTNPSTTEVGPSAAPRTPSPGVSSISSSEDPQEIQTVPSQPDASSTGMTSPGFDESNIITPSDASIVASAIASAVSSAVTSTPLLPCPEQACRKPEEKEDEDHDEIPDFDSNMNG